MSKNVSKVVYHFIKTPFSVPPASAPCAPEILNMTQTNSSTYRVLFTTPNSPNTEYTITAISRYDTHTCQARNNSCELTQLPCGSTYEVTAVATTAVGRSLPGFSKSLETGMTGHFLLHFYLHLFNESVLILILTYIMYYNYHV